MFMFPRVRRLVTYSLRLLTYCSAAFLCVKCVYCTACATVRRIFIMKSDILHKPIPFMSQTLSFSHCSNYLKGKLWDVCLWASWLKNFGKITLTFLFIQHFLIAAVSAGSGVTDYVYVNMFPACGQLVKRSTRHSCFCLPDVCEELTADAKGIGHLFCNDKQVCAAEMAVRYAALCACRKVHTWRWTISENRSFFLFWMFARKTVLL